MEVILLELILQPEECFFGLTMKVFLAFDVAKKYTLLYLFNILRKFEGQFSGIQENNDILENIVVKFKFTRRYMNACNFGRDNEIVLLHL